MPINRLMSIFFACLIVTDVTHAAAPATWYNQVQISYVYSGLTGFNRMAFAVSPAINSGNCPTTNEFEIQRSNPQFDTMVMMVMLAYSRSKPISVYTNGVCGANGLIATDVRLP